MERMQYSHNQSRSMLSRWRKQGDIAEIPRAQSNDNWNRIASTRWVEEASYLRLKTVSLTYNVEREAISRLNIGLQQLSVFVTAYNLSTLSDYLGLDPEVPITGGVTLFGIDSSTTADRRTVVKGKSGSVRVEFGGC